MSDPYLGTRFDYVKGILERQSLPEDPLELLRTWMEAAAGEREPSAMGLSTVGEQGRPSSRMVLLRGIDNGLTFFTNYESRKGEELTANPFASALFWWGERQVRVEGKVEKLSAAESDAYFQSRPLDSRLASAISPQSREIESRQQLEQAMEALREQPPARPAHWGGYRLVPDRIEFWQGREARLHDRFVYERTADGWRIARLAP